MALDKPHVCVGRAVCVCVCVHSVQQTRRSTHGTHTPCAGRHNTHDNGCTAGACEAHRQVPMGCGRPRPQRNTGTHMAGGRVRLATCIGHKALNCGGRAGLPAAGSTEFGPCQDPVVGLLREWQHGNEVMRRSEGGDMGGTMRLGSYVCLLAPGSRVHDIYGADCIRERHRHRYEVNVNYRERLEEAGLRFSGMSPNGVLPEIVELPDHPWYIGVQFHPELQSRPFEPHPLFASFVAAAVAQSRLV